ncbi:hypothetical protein CANINC_003679 [Pichia inconspicua]|uniref:25S rRNA (uridine-N(3))-methyltransferase BMT5-like domain-containing protein n=1 Tax=Pichia inconspicua TaxID=52247 RepID=A0A4T0WY35_9ASCO|nr:hypothetical protein CANINC_003679 [[Candida] inconspicua]
MGKGRGKLSKLLSKQISNVKVNQKNKLKLKNKELHYSNNAKKLQHELRKVENFDENTYDESKVFIPFDKLDRLIIVGDGDFSYSVCIIRKNLIKPDNLITTSYDSLEDLQTKYGNQLIDDNISFLKNSGVKVYHGIDATKLSETLGISLGNKRSGSGAGKSIEKLGGLRINNILFNFPHSGESIPDLNRNVLVHQKLMFNFFKSCEELYHILEQQKEWTNYKESVEDTETDELTYFQNIGKSDNLPVDKNIITVTLFEGEPYDSWKIKKIARDSIGYAVQRSGKLEWRFFDGYDHKLTTRLGKTSKPTKSRVARIFKFEKFHPSEKQKIALDKKRKRNGDYSDDSD